MKKVLSGERVVVRDQLFNQGGFRHGDATDLVAGLSDFELVLVVDDLARGDYAMTTLYEYRAQQRAKEKAALEAEATFVAGQDGLVAADEALVLQNRQQATGA